MSLSVQVNTSKEYEAVIGGGILSAAGDIIPKKLLSGSVAVITDSNVEKLYAEILIKALYGKVEKLVLFSFPAGEESKNLSTLGNILEFLAENEITRSDLIIALGGGVVGDIAGFAAGIYLRGIPFIGIPTTFLAAIDSSVGGKTGIDLQSGKNLAGVFKQPELVITDTDTFKTLADETFSDGVAEILKSGIIADNALFEAIANNRRGGIMKRIDEIVKRGIEIKADIVESDEFDGGRRQLLNLGHTLGHAIEKLSGYKITHGHAVATGIAIITRAAAKLGHIEKSDAEKIEKAICFHSFETETVFSVKALCEAALNDKKRSKNTINLVMPKKIGECFLSPTPIERLEEIITLGIT